MVAYELKNKASVTTQGEHPADAYSAADRDNRQLQRLGKKPVLKRNFGILSILGFSCTILGTWEGLLGTFVNPLQNGGSGGAVYAFIFAWVGTACTFVVLGELGSMAPTSGGQYHWCAMLAPIKQQKFLSYITGWMAVMGWQTAFASASYLCGTEIQGTAILAHKYYNAEAWHGTLIVWAALVVSLLANLIGGKFLPRLEAVILVIHIIGFFGILIPLTYMSEHKNTDEVFLQFLNSGEFPTQGLSWFVGMTSCAFAFAGGDAAVHMAEEVNNATMVIPRALLMSVGINGCLGFGMLIGMLFCLGNMDDALNTPTGYPFIEVFYQGTGSMSGSLTMCSIILIIAVCSVVGLLAATSRQFWSFARDRGVPGWRMWSRVSPSNQLPMYSVLLTTTISWLLALINIGSSVALNDILSMAVSGLYSSYLIVTILLLVRRVKGDVARYNDDEDEIINLPGKKLVWGPFHVPGIWGIAVNSFAVIYIIIVIFFSFWPTAMNPSVTDMNYSVVGWGGVLFLATLYYVVRARHIYTGPVVEVSL
ncbi:amino acid/polyamine transporter I [Penicillium argentinense]|uniref:Amino acid/polyamine transporter I n=1 Tax=Penicillium argentinense TaxID=1131581 RepID=A0A9W9FEY3_9EURO|nr:amino acid/polyamine transporter I [Penicillium argentinense]KAJ5098931.1 amino acid/polyamine transporter I [Penicillium argentinense]